MPLKLDFLTDYAFRCSTRLIEAGYAAPTGNAEAVIGLYVKAANRRVATRKRRVFKRAYSVPDDLKAGETLLLNKVAAGQDIWPHQSRAINDAEANDGMLNDFNIQHFHLGLGPDTKKPYLIQGTKPLLFAIVTDDEFYSLGVYDHQSWYQLDLLDVVHETWPHLLASHVAQGVLAIDGGLRYTAEEIKMLRRAGISAATTRPDGTTHFSPGHGLTATGESFKAHFKLTATVKDIKSVQNVIEDFVTQHVASARLSPDTEVKLEWRGDETFVVTEPVAFEMSIQQLLSVPPI